LIFSAVMGTASLLLIVEAIKRLIDDPLASPDVGNFNSLSFLIELLNCNF